MPRPARTAAAAFFGVAAFWVSRDGDAVVVKRSNDFAKSELDAYTFERYIHDFGRRYVAGSDEYLHRASIFEASLAQVQAVNARNAREGRLWKAGVHPFMDWTAPERERLNGYKPSADRGATQKSGGGVPLLQSGTNSRDRSRSNATLDWEDAFGGPAPAAQAGGLGVDAGPAMRNQGNCGSCWAISAVEAVEAQLQRSGAPRGYKVSAQALIDCVANPQHCGGNGGCEGATGELAYAFMRDHGVPMEPEMPYSAKTHSCPMQPVKGAWKVTVAPRVRLDGWMQLPSNKLEPLMNALTQHGPAVVAVDANPWFDYESGIFDGCSKDAILGHAVLAKGFGQEAGNKFWLIQNSWGANWGEKGHIRLIRRDNEASFCGINNKPKEGVGCDGGPPQVTVCGSCGILYDPIVPTGVRLEAADGKPVAADATLAAVPQVSEDHSDVESLLNGAIE